METLPENINFRGFIWTASQTNRDHKNTYTIKKLENISKNFLERTATLKYPPCRAIVELVVTWLSWIPSVATPELVVSSLKVTYDGVEMAAIHIPCKQTG